MPVDANVCGAFVIHLMNEALALSSHCPSDQDNQLEL